MSTFRVKVKTPLWSMYVAPETSRALEVIPTTVGTSVYLLAGATSISFTEAMSEAKRITGGGNLSIGSLALYGRNILPAGYVLDITNHPEYAQNPSLLLTFSWAGALYALGVTVPVCS